MFRAVLTPRQKAKRVVLAREIREQLTVCLGEEGLAGDKDIENLLADASKIPESWKKVGHFYHFFFNLSKDEIYPAFARYLRWDGRDWDVRPCSQEDVLGERDFIVLNPGF